LDGFKHKLQELSRTFQFIYIILEPRQKDEWFLNFLYLVVDSFRNKSEKSSLIDTMKRNKYIKLKNKTLGDSSHFIA
jgi:hypothetical protein